MGLDNKLSSAIETFAEAAKEKAATRSDGVRHGKCRGGEESRLRCIFGYLLVAGTDNPGLHRARQDKRKVLNAHFAIPLFSSNR